MYILLRPLFTIFLALTLITGVIYPLTVTAIAQGLFPNQSNGSIIERNGQVVGSALLGQAFDQPEYFWGRLSATAHFPYNPAASSGSNYGPLYPTLKTVVQARIDALKTGDPDNGAAIPVDLVTASASGLDPHISPAAAEYQVARVAHARSLPEERIRQLVTEHTASRTFYLLGEPRVNVLELNLALDAME